jgi:hypothetical protein
MEIEDPPERPVCSGCMSPLIWIYPARTRRWVAMVAESNRRLEAHRCDDRGVQLRETPDPAIAASAHRGNELARRVLAGDSPFTDEH